MKVIPVEAVEAAALALYERDYGVTDWDIVSVGTRDNYIDEARTALEAAAPYMMAGAWDEGYHTGDCESFDSNPYRTAQ